MLERAAEKEINEWLRKPAGALLVSGARQVGKTFTIRKCLRQTSASWLEINLIEHPEIIPSLEQSRTVSELLINLSTAFAFRFEPGKTVLFFDEIQEFSDIVTRIKFWVDDGRFRYILSGSLLGIELRGIRSAPVGYLRIIEMYPLDFTEFLLGTGIPDEVIEHLQECYIRKEPVGSLIHEKIMTHFRRYLITGGMPQAVEEYVASGDMRKVTEIQKGILAMHQLDFTRYEKMERRLNLISVFTQVPSQLLKQNRRFSFADLKKGLRYEKLENSFLWLTCAGVVIPTYNTTEPKIALEQNAKHSLVKLYCADVGLLTCQYGSAVRIGILQGASKINLGGVFENAVAQELNSNGYQTYFYHSHGKGELDFLIEQNGEVVPIEVKSGKDYYIHSALTKTLTNPEYNIRSAIVLADCNISQVGNITYYPVYMTTFIRDSQEYPKADEIELRS